MPDPSATTGTLALVAVLAYLLGAVPFGIVMARLFGLGDLRKIGSGNIGATNVLRTGNKLAALLTLLLDAGKGAIAFLGTLLALAWPVGLLSCATWLVVALVSRYSSLSALVSAALAPIWMVFTGHIDLVLPGAILTLLIYVRHWQNIVRLKQGTEPKIGRNN